MQTNTLKENRYQNFTFCLTSSIWCAHFMITPSMVFFRSISQSSPLDSRTFCSSSATRLAPCYLVKIDKKRYKYMPIRIMRIYKGLNENEDSCTWGKGNKVLPLMWPRIWYTEVESSWTWRLMSSATHCGYFFRFFSAFKIGAITLNMNQWSFYVGRPYSF